MALPNHSSPSSSSRVEIVIGRSMAAFVHPVAAWYSLTKPGRVLLAGFYGAVGYVAVLTALLILS